MASFDELTRRDFILQSAVLAGGMFALWYIPTLIDGGLPAVLSEARAAGKLTIAPIPRCAGDQYPQLVLGVCDIALFERALPWDHAAGALFLEEAGGVIRRIDGSTYHVGDGQTGLLGASSQAMWDDAARVLFG